MRKGERHDLRTVPDDGRWEDQRVQSLGQRKKRRKRQEEEKKKKNMRTEELKNKGDIKAWVMTWALAGPWPLLLRHPQSFEALS